MDTHTTDEQELERFGYRQELKRSLGLFSSFAAPSRPCPIADQTVRWWPNSNSVCARFAPPPEGSRAAWSVVEWELLMHSAARRIALVAVQAALAR